jgi:hypothetical protein
LPTQHGIPKMHVDVLQVNPQRRSDKNLTAFVANGIQFLSKW